MVQHTVLEHVVVQRTAVQYTAVQQTVVQQTGSTWRPFMMVCIRFETVKQSAWLFEMMRISATVRSRSGSTAGLQRDI